MMKKYRVGIPYVAWVYTTVEANDEDDAIDKAMRNTPTAYCGNGGSDKLVGVSRLNSSIEISDCESSNYEVPDIEVEIVNDETQ